jgi:hypothetical protein
MIDIKIPTEWEMYTRQGNLSLTNRAARLVQRINQYPNQMVKQLHCIHVYFRSICRMSKTNLGEGIWDTEPRSHIVQFAINLGKQLGITETTIRTLWDHLE